MNLLEKYLLGDIGQFKRLAYINGVKRDDECKEIRLMN